MICRIGDVVRRGRVVSVKQDVDQTAVAAAVRADDADPDAPVAVTARSQTTVHEQVGCIHPGMGLRTRTALARAARTRGLTTPHDDQLQETRESLAALDMEDESTASYRRELAETTADIERLQEEVAAARGRLQARREQGLDTTAAAEELEDAIRRLSEAETSASAIRQQLDRARAAARGRRDTRDRRLRLEDRVANLERRARAHLVDQLHEAFATTVPEVPVSEADTPPDGNAFETDAVTAALAIARLAVLSAPVVLDCDRFDSPVRAYEWLDAPVIYL